MKKGAGYYIIIILAVLGVLAGLAFGFMNSAKLGWRYFMGSEDEKKQLKALDDAATALANKDPKKKVEIVVTDI